MEEKLDIEALVKVPPGPGHPRPLAGTGRRARAAVQVDCRPGALGPLRAAAGMGQGERVAVSGCTVFHTIRCDVLDAITLPWSVVARDHRFAYVVVVSADQPTGMPVPGGAARAAFGLTAARASGAG